MESEHTTTSRATLLDYQRRRPRNTRRYVLASIASGCAWGLLGLFFGSGVMGPIVWGGVIASPLIGLLVGLSSREACVFRRSGRVIVSLATLYLAFALFGLAVGVYDSTRPIPNRDNFEVIWQSILGTLAGGTMLIVALWPLSYWNHKLLWQLDELK